MKRVFIALALLVCLPTLSLAEDVPIPGCGSDLHTANTSGQLGSGAWLQYIVETRIDLNLCVLGVGVSAYVAGVDGTALNRSGLFSATASRQVPLPGFGVWTTNGFHTAGSPIPFLLIQSSTMSQATVTAPIEEVYDPPQECDGDIDPDTGKCIRNSCPIIISMDRKNYKLTGSADGVTFDLKGNGNPLRLGWTEAGSPQAFLAFDRNGNGRIDNGTELFGSQTPVLDGRSTAPNGFEALRFLSPPTVGGSVLDARSPAWSHLLLWVDANHNGVSEPDELTRLADAGVAAIDLDYKYTGRKDKFGNWFRQRADLHWVDGGKTTVYDVWLTAR
jgi:hypothetical protein